VIPVRIHRIALFGNGDRGFDKVSYQRRISVQQQDTSIKLGFWIRLPLALSIWGRCSLRSFEPQALEPVLLGKAIQYSH
jgi:hypothetical protein